MEDYISRGKKIGYFEESDNINKVTKRDIENIEKLENILAEERSRLLKLRYITKWGKKNKRDIVFSYTRKNDEEIVNFLEEIIKNDVLKTYIANLVEEDINE